VDDRVGLDRRGHKAGTSIWSQSQCDARLLHDLTTLGIEIDHLTAGNPTGECQKAAICSFAYNVGIEKLHASTLLRYHNDGNFAGAASQFAKWVYGNHKPMAGLIKRRADEAALYARKP
jgi:lysozyme